jgi:hypothetical protein
MGGTLYNGGMSPDSMAGAIIANLPAKTGKSLAEWIEVLRTQSIAVRKEKIAWLKAEHGLGHVQAEMVVWHDERPADYVAKSDDELFDAQYAGVKAHLRPVGERLVALIRGVGPDVSLGYRDMYVGASRKKQFAAVQPTNRTRVDLGLRLKDVPGAEALEPAKGVGGGSITHKLSYSSLEEIGPEAEAWIRKAYEAAG